MSGLHSLCQPFWNLIHTTWHFLLFVMCLTRYGRVYATAADPYHHSVGPTTTYGVGTVVSYCTQSLCWKPCCPMCSSRQALIKPAMLLLSTGQFIQRRVQPLHPVLSHLSGAGAGGGPLWYPGIIWSTDAAGQIRRASKVQKWFHLLAPPRV